MYKILIASVFKDKSQKKEKKERKNERGREEEDRCLRDIAQYVYLLFSFCSCGVFLSLLATLYKLISLQYNFLQWKSNNSHI